MNLQQPYSDEVFQLQTKILTKDNPHDLERIVNDYLEILAYKKTCRVVDITYQMRKTHLLSSLCGLFGSQQVDEYSAMITKNQLDLSREYLKQKKHQRRKINQ